MKPAEIRNLETEALKARLKDAQEELMRLRFQQATGELTDYSRLHITRRDIARMMTVLHERESAPQEEGEA